MTARGDSHLSVGSTRARRSTRLVAVALLTAVLVACGTARPPEPDLEASGHVVLPPGSPLVLADLIAAGPFGTVAVAADGAFSVPMALGGPGLVVVTNAAGQVVLLGYVDTADDAAVVSAATTATALLYLAVGGPFMPGDPGHVLDLVAADPNLADLSAATTALLAADPLALANGDAALVDAVLAARDAIASGQEATVPSNVTPGAATRATGAEAASRVAAALLPSTITGQGVEGSGNVIITDAGRRGGFDLLISEDGYGVKVQNTLRRPARLLLYRTAVKVGDGPVVEYGTGQPVGDPIVVAPSRALNLFLSLGDALTGGSPFAPVVSQDVPLSLVGGTTRTYYTAVLLTPSLQPGATPAVFTDARFFPFRSQWDNLLVDLQFETWWTSLLFPLMSSMAFGITAQVEYAALAEHSAAVRTLSEPVLAARGVGNPLTGDRAKALLAAIEEAALGADTHYFWDLVEHARDALGVPPQGESAMLSARAYMGALAKAAGIVAVVDALLAGGDIVAMLHDMGSNGPAETYEPVRVQARAELRPAVGQVQKLVAPSQVFNVIVDPPFGGGTYLYRWSTTGEYGFISDYLDEGLSIDSRSSEIFYLANEPAVITEELHDQITVEVYLDDGSGIIPAGAEPVTVASAAVVGKERRDLIPGSYVLVTDSYPSNGTTRYCGAAYIVFERQPGATRYDIEAFNFYDRYYYGSSLSKTVMQYADIPTYLPPCDQRPVSMVGNQLYVFLSAGHGQEPDTDGWWDSRFGGMIVEVTVTY